MNRAERRKSDFRHALKKHALAIKTGWHTRKGEIWGYNKEYGYKEFDSIHQYSKGKITPDDRTCKTRNKSYSRRHRYGNYNESISYKHSDQIKVDKLDLQEQEYYDN